MQHRNKPPPLTLSGLQPCVAAGSRWMSNKVEHLDGAFPYGLTLESLGYWDGFHPFGPTAVKLPDSLCEAIRKLQTSASGVVWGFLSKSN